MGNKIETNKVWLYIGLCLKVTILLTLWDGQEQQHGPWCPRPHGFALVCSAAESPDAVLSHTSATLVRRYPATQGGWPTQEIKVTPSALSVIISPYFYPFLRIFKMSTS